MDSPPPPVHIDLPGVHPQEVDEVGPWVFLDEAADPSVVFPDAVLIGGDEEEPLVVRVLDIAGENPDRRVRVDVLGVLIAADLNFESDEAGVVLARMPATVPSIGAEAFAGTSRAAWSRARVEAVEGGWLQLRLLATPDA
ncbi:MULTISPECIES: hypothetical protein [unclassified Modestobacter]|uniref:hypothetical protein n=1 Tax=unclassified Modestobacter TaxID=2643866 RepID=UPI0022AA02EE|nr:MULTISPECIES: hypothetical protein [unclassified Modestobacter]MCZ2826008.1 hypothetical protein [Modestobacter sp. VKM Ac-2981]MCZ2852927.1 hypothetical protein [Modestobacter sp. VKM Ac-2982]